MAHKDLENAHKRRVDELKSGMQAEKCKATFACGGSLTLSPENNDNVTVRFGPDGKGSKLSLPCKGDDPAFQKLIAACDPASFGKGGQDVFDETYRKATKLNQDDFCTDFCPYTLGMVDIINQLLVPSIDKKRSVRAELYKLNVYSGPSGKFKAHVDTPRSEMQVGSLVVCLPSPFTGGNFSVRHRSETIDFNWASNSATSVQWTAFYSDCEHEVHQVTDGHRITLTYNLFLTARTDLQAGCQLSLDGTQLPFSRLLKAAISDPRFMFKGGNIGIYLAHLYPHTHTELSKLLPACLKGTDMSIYESVRALGLKSVMGCTTRHSLEPPSEYDDENGEWEDEDIFGKYFPFLKTLYTDDSMTFEGDEDEEYDFHGAESMREGEFVLLNKPAHAEMFHYGNEASLTTEYSNAALIIKIPSAEERWESNLCDHVQFIEAGKDFKAGESEKRKTDGGYASEDDMDQYSDEDDGEDFDNGFEVPYHGEFAL